MAALNDPRLVACRFQLDPFVFLLTDYPSRMNQEEHKQQYMEVYIDFQKKVLPHPQKSPNPRASV